MKQELYNVADRNYYFNIFHLSTRDWYTLVEIYINDSLTLTLKYAKLCGNRGDKGGENGAGLD